jgi:hypothetical protein
MCIINETPLPEDVWGTKGIAPPFLTSALDGGEWSVLRSGRVNPGETAPDFLWMGGIY